MAIEHIDIPNADLHEPKGASAANVDEVYTSDGAGSGAWQKITASQIDSAAENAGKLITADGAGGAMWGGTLWEDILGNLIVRDTGATAPTLGAFRGGQVQQFSFAANDVVGFTFHIPHNYKPGTDIYLHTHWAHNGTAISGNMVWTYYATYAKGHGQAIFPAEVTGTISIATPNIATIPQYMHRIEEVQLSAAAPSAAQLDTDNLEVDGLILVQMVATTIPTITGGTPNEPFLLQVDIHYQVDTLGTKNKVPNFYV